MRVLLYVYCYTYTTQMIKMCKRGRMFNSQLPLSCNNPGQLVLIHVP